MDPQPDKAVLHTNCAQRLQDQAAFVERVTYRWMVPQQCGQSFLWSLASCWDSWESEISICPWMSLCFPASSSPSPLCVESVQPSPPWRHCGLFYPAMCFHNFFQEMNYLTAHFFCQTWWKLAWEFRAYTCRGWPTGKQTHANNRFLSASYKLATTSAGTETAPSFWPCHEPSRLNTLRWPLSWKPWSPGLSTVLFPNLSFKSGLCLERCGWTGIALWPPASSGDGWTGNIYLTCYKVITAGFLQAICRKKTLNQGNIDST